jgi:two-component system OmpR family sensor kinase
LLARSQNLGGLRLPDEAHAASLVHAAPQLYTRPVPGGRLRVYSLPAVRDGHRVGLVLLAASLDEVTATSRTPLVLLVAGGLGVTLLAVGGGSVLVRRGLRPLGEMAAVAERITAQQLDQRLMLHDPPAEVARLARTFDAMLGRLHEAFAAQRRFVADASHELRTPLATLHGRSEVLLLDPALDPDTRAGLLILRDESARMGRLVANLLLVARGDEDLAINRRPVELDLVLLDVAQQARTLASERGVTVTLGQEDRAAMLGDADLLKQAILNLVENAIAHTPPGGQVELSLAVANGSAHLAVHDTGQGIAANHLPHLFERFYRADPARSRHTGGAGLGLSIVRWIVEAHGGHVAVESVAGHGSTFTIVLPLSDQTLTVP